MAPLAKVAYRAPSAASASGEVGAPSALFMPPNACQR
ncbi:Uncharacterised protein [Mycobacterium tuberculosis]|uniref:Uncharacterized protein n=1 Tax=Mycobacterium tuberculosis TaxID=1773 RepID=A0A916LGY6_MYCTX|nr:Uncharacterised protein [Mycobacterium tuberculosis]